MISELDNRPDSTSELAFEKVDTFFFIDKSLMSVCGHNRIFFIYHSQLKHIEGRFINTCMTIQSKNIILIQRNGRRVKNYAELDAFNWPSNLDTGFNWG